MIYNVSLEDSNKTGIYSIRNIKNNKIYIGQTRQGFRSRYNKHLSQFKSGKGHGVKFKSDYKNGSPDDFIFEIVEIVEDNNLLDQKEIFYIEQYNSIEDGYNISKGENRSTCITRPETIEKMKLNVTEEFREMRRIAMSNRVVSEDTKARIRFANIGEKSPVAVLNDEAVKTIKERLVKGESLKSITESTEYNYNTLSAVSQGITWKHVTVDGWEDYLMSKKGHSIFTPDEVYEIRKLLAEGYNQSEVARMYGCCQSKINGIARGKTFKNI